MKCQRLIFLIAPFLILTSCNKKITNSEKISESSSITDKKTTTDSTEETLPLPDILKDTTFVFDQLETRTGNNLYILTISQAGHFTLYQDKGVGIIQTGEVVVYSGKRIKLGTYLGTYKGSKFETPSITIPLDGKETKFKLTKSETEYVYLDYLGVYSARSEEKNVYFVLDRFKEYFLYDGKNVKTGNYDVYSGNRISLTGDENLDATITKGGFGFSLDIPYGGMNLSFAYATSDSKYSASHAMGTYTLERFDDMFTIKRTDGLIKAIGTMEFKDETHGICHYFPRIITGGQETNLEVDFTYTEDEFIFPKTTPVLPTSGDFSSEGVASYWQIGSILDFRYEGTEEKEDNTTEYDVVGKVVKEDETPLEGAKVLLDDEDIGKTTDRDGSFILKKKTGHHFVTFLKDGYSIDMAEVDHLTTEVRSIARSGEDKVRLPENEFLDQTLPSLGISRPLTLLIDFSDAVRPRFLNRENIENGLFSLSDRNSLTSYYFRSSYGKCHIQGHVEDWYRMKYERSYYESDKAIMEEVLRAKISEGLNLDDYDSNKDGVIDALYVIWAGNMITGNEIFNAAYRSTWENPPNDFSKEISGYIFVPGTTIYPSAPPVSYNLNPLIHETGHLMGLNDYYSYDTTDRSEKDYSKDSYTGGALEGGIDNCDMMDSDIGEHNAFSKYLLGWLNPIVIEWNEIKTLNQKITLRPCNLYGDALFIKLKDASSVYTELFVIESFNKKANNRKLTRFGDSTYTKVLHVDASLDKTEYQGNWMGYGFKNDNSFTSTKFISLLEADGKDEIMNFIPTVKGDKPVYDPNDFYKSGSLINDATYPSTKAYDGYGNRTRSTGLSIKIEEDEKKNAVLNLSYQKPEEGLDLISSSPTSTIVPYIDPIEKIDSTNKNFIYTFNYEIQEATQGSLKQIKVASRNEIVDPSQYEVTIDQNMLRISFRDDLEEVRGYTVVIPSSILASKDDSKKKNNYNTIFSYLVSGKEK